jgi:hypothetical protein
LIGEEEPGEEEMGQVVRAREREPEEMMAGEVEVETKQPLAEPPKAGAQQAPHGAA